MISKFFIVMTAVVVAVNAQGTSTSSSAAASPSTSASSLDACTLTCLTAAANGTCGGNLYVFHKPLIN